MEPSGVTSDRIKTWREELKKEQQKQHISATQAGQRIGMAPRTAQDFFGDVKDGPGKVDLDLIWRVSQGFPFSVGEQVQMLLGLTERDLNIQLPLWQPRISNERLIEELSRALNIGDAVAPSVWDLSERLSTSCFDGGQPGRWRSRTFDVTTGWHYPHILARGIEFLRWYGPGRQQKSATELDDVLRGLQRDTHDLYIEDETGFKAQRPKHFQWAGEHADEAWTRTRLERYELKQRLSRELAASRGAWFGAGGDQHVALLHNTSRAHGRHIYLAPHGNPIVKREDVAAVKGEYTTILLIGAGAAQPGRIGDLLAEALGWNSASNRDLAHRLSGRRISLARKSEREVNKVVFEQISEGRVPFTVVSCTIAYLFTESRKNSRDIKPEAKQMLSAAHVLPILLTTDSETLRLWEDRQRAGSVDGVVDIPSNIAAMAAKMTERMKQYLENVPGAIHAWLTPTLPWHGPLTQLSDTSPTPWAYYHPLVGDIQVRAAFELWRGLTVPKPHRIPVQSSLLGHYADKLTHGLSGSNYVKPDYIPGAHRELFFHPPTPEHVQPPLGRVLGVDLIGGRARDSLHGTK